MDFTAPIEPQVFKNSWITIGAFDGVHLGHQALIKGLVNRARKAESPALAITFWPLPATYFKRTPLAWALTSPADRRKLILSLGVDEVFTLDFKQSLADLTAFEFMERLKSRFGVRGVCVGPNFTLGKDREGNVNKLIEIGEELGFQVVVSEPTGSADGMISSSQIRADLKEHRIATANQKLGRIYHISGQVVHGEHRGTGLGIPTANLEYLPERLAPGNGVYVTRALVNGKPYAAVTNIGVRPTFENPLPVPRIEPHILDMEGQLYGQELTLEFIEFLRPEMKFASPEELVNQIQKDIIQTREFFTTDGTLRPQFAI